MKLTDRSYRWLLAILSVIAMLPHSMALWGNGNYPTDACVYVRCAEWIQDGLVMYRDMFDHKGPFVYLIYQLATFLGTFGVWLLDVLILYASLLLIYRMARLFTNNRSSLLIAALMACYVQLPFTDEGGPEWIAMPGCIYGCYLLAKRIKDQAHCSLIEIAIFSAATGICLFTKPNTAAGLVPIALYILWLLIRHFDKKVLGRYIAGVAIGLGIIVLPIAFWLYTQGNLSDFIEAYWRFNTESYAPMTRHKMIMGKLIVTAVCLPGLFAYAAYTYSAYKRRKEWIGLSVLFFFTVLLNMYMKNGYPHYMFPCLAVFALMLSMAWETIRTRKAWRIATISLFLLVGIGSFGARAYLRLRPFDTSKDRQTAQFINAHTDDNDYVMVCDVDDRSRWSSGSPSYSFVYRLWLLLDAKPASPYFYLPPSISDAMRAKSWDMITERMPKYVVCTDEHEADYLGLGYTRIRDIENDYYLLQRP